MPPTPRRAVVAFRRRVAVGAFLGGAMWSAGWLAVLAAAVQLGVRLGGGHLPPQAWWAALLVPVLGAGLYRARREALAAGVAAAHLDVRLGLDGLLLSAHEGQQLDGVYQQRLDRRLAALPSVLPRPRWATLLPLPMLALALAFGLALLPPPVRQDAAGPPAVLAELEKVAASMRDLFERAEVPEEVRAELQQRLDDLRQKAEAGEVPDWRDLDALDQRLEREQLLAAAAAQLPKNAAAGAGGGAVAALAGAVAAAAKALAERGMLDRLPADVLAALRKAEAGDGSFGAEALALDAAMLARLAEAFGGLLGQLGALEASGGIDPAALADLQQLLARFGAGADGGHPGWGGEGEGEGEGEGAGRGGLGRGPGHAALTLAEPALGGAAGAMVLPPGHALPGEWVPVGSSPTAPTVDPQRAAAAGGAAAAGAGGASWQLHLPPRHRAVLQRFFGTDPAAPTPPGKDKK